MEMFATFSGLDVQCLTATFKFVLLRIKLMQEAGDTNN